MKGSDTVYVQKILEPMFPGVVAEYRFHPTRKWRVDLCWPARKLMLEIEGGVWVGGRHTRPVGYMKDIEKYNEAAVMGYTLVRVTPQMLKNGEAVTLLERIFKQERPK